MFWIAPSQQIITQQGELQIVVVPYLDYLELTGQRDENATIPHEVVKRHVIESMSLIKAWRTHLKLTQDHVAGKMGITLSAYFANRKSGF